MPRQGISSKCTTPGAAAAAAHHATAQLELSTKFVKGTCLWHCDQIIYCEHPVIPHNWVAGSTREVSGNLYPGIRAVSTNPGDCGSTRIRVSGQKAESCVSGQNKPIREDQSGQNKPSGYPGETWASGQSIGASWYHPQHQKFPIYWNSTLLQ